MDQHGLNFYCTEWNFSTREHSFTPSFLCSMQALTPLWGLVVWWFFELDWNKIQKQYQLIKLFNLHCRLWRPYIKTIKKHYCSNLMPFYGFCFLIRSKITCKQGRINCFLYSLAECQHCLLPWKTKIWDGEVFSTLAVLSLDVPARLYWLSHNAA